MDRVAGLKTHHFSPAPLRDQGLNLARRVREPGLDVEAPAWSQLDLSGHAVIASAKEPSYARMIRVLGAEYVPRIVALVQGKYILDVDQPGQPALAVLDAGPISPPESFRILLADRKDDGNAPRLSAGKMH